jgi:hypothetical protein
MQNLKLTQKRGFLALASYINISEKDAASISRLKILICCCTCVSHLNGKTKTKAVLEQRFDENNEARRQST